MSVAKAFRYWQPFPQDIRDLVELTVGKMEMYHLVAALFMESSMALYFEGRIRHIAPPFVIGLLFISIASAYMPAAQERTSAADVRMYMFVLVAIPEPATAKLVWAEVSPACCVAQHARLHLLPQPRCEATNSLCGYAADSSSTF